MTRGELAQGLRSLSADEATQLLRELLEKAILPPPHPGAWAQQANAIIDKYRPALERLATR